MNAARFGAAYAALMAAHDVADHVVQTDAQAAGKAQDWAAMAGHISSYQAVQLAAVLMLRRCGVRPRFWRVLAAAAWSAGTHTLLDRRWPVVQLLCLTGSRRFAEAPGIPFTSRPVVYGHGYPHVNLPGQVLPLHGPYLADQACHHAALVVAAAILAGGPR